MIKKRRKVLESTKKIVASNQEWKCGFCKHSLPPSYQIDHITPYSISNSDELSNLMALCPTCHANKTQCEAIRINEYKRMKEYCSDNTNLCWFCFETYFKFHECSREKHELRNILCEQQEYIQSFKDRIRRYSYIPRILENVTSDMRNMNISIEPNTLKIKLYSDLLYVNNYFTSISSYNIDEILNAVFIATRTKRDSKKYDRVEIEINIENIEDNCVEFLDDNLRDNLPNRIFRNSKDIEYIYILNN